MADQARVTSLDALEHFRSSLIVFATTAHRSVDEVGDYVRRMRMWLQNDQRLYWEGEIRKRRKLLSLAEQELMTARLSKLRDNISAQENAVRKAKKAVQEGEEKLANVKRWSRDFDHAVEPLVKKLEGLREYLNHDLPKGLAFLVQAQKTLEAYSETGRTPGSPGGASPGPGPEEGSGSAEQNPNL